MMSASESICTPNRDVAFRRRAMRPSIPSRKAASSTMATAVSKRPSKASLMPVRPAQMASTVMRFGTISRTGISLSRGPRPLSTGRGASAGEAGVSIRLSFGMYSDAAADGRTLDGAEFGKHGFAADGSLADGNPRLGPGRQQHVETRTEADEAEALAGIDRLGRLDPADDAARDETGDLDDADLAVAGLD